MVEISLKNKMGVRIKERDENRGRITITSKFEQPCHTPNENQKEVSQYPVMGTESPCR